MRRPISIIFYTAACLSILCIGYAILWQFLAMQFKNKLEYELESLEYGIETNSGQLNYGLVSVTGFPNRFIAHIDKFTMQYHQAGYWFLLSLPESVEIHRPIFEDNFTIKLPKLMEFRMQHLQQKQRTSYLFQSTRSPTIQIELPAAWYKDYFELHQGLPNLSGFQEALKQFKLHFQDSNLLIQIDDYPLVRQHVEDLSFRYARQILQDNPKDEYQFQLQMQGYTVQDAIDERWLSNLPYYRFFSQYLKNAQPMHVACQLSILGPKAFSEFLYEDSSYRLQSCKIQNELGTLHASSQLALFKNKQSMIQGNVNIELNNYVELAKPLLNSVEPLLTLPILSNFIDPKPVRAEAPLDHYKALFLDRLTNLGQESDNGKNLSILIQFQDNKTMIKDDLIEKKLPQALSPLKAIQSFERLIKQPKPKAPTQKIDEKMVWIHSIKHESL